MSTSGYGITAFTDAGIGYIGEQDLTKAAMVIQSRTFEAFIPLITAAVIYLALVMLLTFFMNKLERRLRTNER